MTESDIRYAKQMQHSKKTNDVFACGSHIFRGNALEAECRDCTHQMLHNVVEVQYTTIPVGSSR